jgi:primase-polymerase (primpol)-like protein
LGRRFVGWKAIPNTDPAKPPRKVPIRPCDGKWASSADPEDWGTLDEALEAFLRNNLSGRGRRRAR